MKTMFSATGIWSVLSLTLLFSCNAQPSPEAKKPNVILINADDLGWADLGCMGSGYYETPNIDRLGREGMLFTQAYASAANCAPSRAHMITGLWGPRHGIYTVGSSERGNTKTRRLIPTPNAQSIPDSLYTLGEMFHDNGYRTASIGKWHISESPLTEGFDVNIAGSHRGGPGHRGYFSPYNAEHLEAGPQGEYLTDRLTSEAISFINGNKEKPFFLYLPFYAVHKPLMAKEEVEAIYRAKKGAEGQSDATYAAMIHTMDENVGRLLTTLKNLGIEENTIVIFTSDNGGIRDVSHQDPLRAGKGSYYEGGIRVPLIVKWPGHVKNGTVTEQPVIQRDLYPTLQSMIGAEKKAKHLDGTDISPLLKGEPMPERDFFWHFPVYLQAYNPLEDQARDLLFRTRPGSVIRSGPWKLHEYFEDGGLELYNLGDDPGERHNVAGEHPEKVRELRDRLEAWRTLTGAPVPTEKNPGFDKMFEIKKQQQARTGS
ncbi:sulfatase [Sinomicrobium soli]|uniref:sulfatase n=1 Tax=Sinomicrobium sp. N-1-3-6 TaxID=2219864 RepID=UPI000DCBB2DF|nr:sulfatase [Sinomicrobium sp. N-1-3-6]RAV28092.1 aryl-sulfate sulfohydrolase [Sinomicrobium sp. N-1-3-6]